MTGAARLAALYLATHAAGSFLGWQVMAEAEPPGRAAEDEPDEDEDDEQDQDEPTKPKIPTVDKTSDQRLSRLTKYNVFCPSCAPEEEAAADDDVPMPDGIDVEDLEFPDAVRSQLPLALVATMEAESPGISLATISNQDGATGVYAEGEEVMDAVTLLSVDLGLVYLRTATRVEYLQISDEMPPPPKATTPAEDDEDDKDKPKSKYEIEGASDAINCQGMSCTVERRFVNQLLANPAQLTRQGNARPYARDDLKGFRLSRVKSGTVPKLLGLRSGDVITGINGQPLDSLDGAMKLYTKLRSASNLNVDLVRNRGGERQQLRLDITIQ
ncbi:MAG: type II secretion system protein GspC [Nannocystaceae bacterium]